MNPNPARCANCQASLADDSPDPRPEGAPLCGACAAAKCPQGLPPPAFLKSWIVLGFFAVLVTLLRLSTFFASTLDWDESQYLLIADDWLDGHAPYTTVWDNKPPGIYALFALSLKVLGHSVAGIRAMTCIFVTLTCFFLYRIGRLFQREGWLIGLLAGVLFALLTVNGGGLASNTEIFFTTFTTMAFFQVLSLECASEERRFRRWRSLGSAGLLLGIGFEIKYSVLFDTAAIAAMVAIAQWRRPARPGKVLSLAGDLAVLGAGFGLPFLGVTLLFTVTHHFGEYWYANVTANRMRTIAQPFSASLFLASILQQKLKVLMFWGCIPAALVHHFRVRDSGPRDRGISLALLGWFAVILLGLGVIFRNRLYDHYFLQLAPVLSLLSASMVARLLLWKTAGPAPQAMRGRWLCLAGFLGAMTLLLASRTLVLGAKQAYFVGLKGNRHWADWEGQVADYLGPRLSPEDHLYVVDGEPVLYFLTRARLPTRYVFPAFLIHQKDLPNIIGVDPLQELDRIMKKAPVYVVKNCVEANPDYTPDTALFFEALHGYLARDYVLETTIKKVHLYRLKARS